MFKSEKKETKLKRTLEEAELRLASFGLVKFWKIQKRMFKI